MTLAAQALPFIKPQYFTNAGLPNNGGSIQFYAAGTTTPQATYTDATKVTPNANPVVLDSAGRADIYLDTTLGYKAIAKDSLGNILWTEDNIWIVNPASIGAGQLASSAAGLGLIQDADGALDVQVDGVTTQINGSNQVAVKSGAQTPALFNPNNLIEILTQTPRDLTCPGLIQQIPQYPWLTPTQLSGPTLAGAPNCVAWSPNGEFLAIGTTASPYLYLYQKAGSGSLMPLTTVHTINGSLAGPTSALAWSPCGDFLMISGNTTGGMAVWNRIGNTFTVQSPPASAPVNATGGNLGGAIFSPNSDFVALSYAWSITFPFARSGNNLLLYERNGLTFTDIGTITGSGVSTINGNNYCGIVRFSPDSYIFGAMDNGNVTATGLLNLWSRADNIFTNLGFSGLTSYAGNITDYKFSSDGNLFAASLSVSPYILVFQRTGPLGTTFTQLATQPAGAPGTCSCIDFSANSQYLLAGDSSGTSPYMTIWQIGNPSGVPTFTPVANPSSLPTGDVTCASWTKTKQFLAVGTANTPYLNVYQTAGVFTANSLPWYRTVPNV